MDEGDLRLGVSRARAAEESLSAETGTDSGTVNKTTSETRTMRIRTCIQRRMAVVLTDGKAVSSPSL